MEIIYYFLIFLFGTCVGSFLGVVIDRLPRGENISKGRSHCDHCKKTLTALDLIPIFSFLFLRGRCRHCGARLSLFYPIVEIVTGSLFVIAALHVSSMYQVVSIMYMIELFYYLFIISSLIVLFFIDLKYGILPFSIMFPAMIVTFLFILLNTNNMIQNHFLAALGAFGFFLALFLLTRGRGMGFGDVVYVFLMGLLLGFPSIVLGLYMAFVSGAIVAVILVLLHKKKMRGSTIPFGPFLVFGTLICLLWGDHLTKFVLRLLLG
ncbi:MAG TPA: prepilin peptidase [Patescibacteria group bacterium]|nr:prepilin peptidase [Patescibacteria group bacterium]